MSCCLLFEESDVTTC